MMKRGKHYTKRNSRDYCLDVVYNIILFLIGICFFFFLGKDGYILEKDSNTFLGDKHWVKSYGYIVYPIFINWCRWFFGEWYLEAIFIIQSLFALFTSYIVAEYIRTKYLLSRTLGVIVFVLSFGPYTYTLPQYVSNHVILTEGITFPLFNLWMICAIEIYRNKNKFLYIVAILVLSILLTITRPPLLVLLVSFIIILFDVFRRELNVKEKKISAWKRRLIDFSIGIALISLGIASFFVIIRKAYFPQLTDAVAGRILCTVQKDDIDLYSGDMKELFEEVYYEIDERGDRTLYFRNDYKRWVDICKSTNSNTHVIEKIITDRKEIEKDSYNKFTINEYEGELIYPLLLQHWDEYLLMTGELIIQSLIVSIFIHPDWGYLICSILAIIMYAMSIILLIVLKKKKMLEYIVPIKTVLIVIAIMCGLTNVVFMGIQRYVVYPFGWFHIAIGVMLHGLSIGRIQESKGIVI